MERFLGYGRQTITDDDIQTVVQALRGDFLTQGPTVTRFENAIAEYVGAKHAIVMSSGTAALHIASLAAGADGKTHGVTQPLTFVASANGLRYCGASVGLVDIDPTSLMMSPEGLAAYLQKKPETRIVVPVSFSGLSTGGQELRRIAGDRILIEDASHSFGALNEDGSKVGGGRWADMTVFSFHPVKPITTAEGGAIVTDNDELARRIRSLISHGLERQIDRLLIQEEAGNPWYYEQQMLGYNYRLTDVQAALGLAQIARVDQFMARRREIALRYDAHFAGSKALTVPLNASAQRARSGHHLYIIRPDFVGKGLTRRAFMEQLRARNIGTQVHYIPVHHQPYYRDYLGTGPGAFPISDAFYANAVSIPCFPGMTDADVDRVAGAINDILG